MSIVGFNIDNAGKWLAIIVPLLGGFAFCLKTSVDLGRIMQKIDTIQSDVTEIKTAIKDHEHRITIMEKK